MLVGIMLSRRTVLKLSITPLRGLLLLVLLANIWKVSSRDHHGFRQVRGVFVWPSSTQTFKSPSELDCESGLWKNLRFATDFDGHSGNASQFWLHLRRPCHGQPGKLNCSSRSGSHMPNATSQGSSLLLRKSFQSGLVKKTSTTKKGSQQPATKVIISKKFNRNAASLEKSPPVEILVAFGGCFLVSCALLCPCLQHKRKNDSKDFPSKETPSNSVSTSLGESSLGGSVSASSTTFSSSSQHPLRKSYGGKTFTFAELSKATRNFSPTFKIGQGGFGTVYKGKLQDGTIVAIKRAKKKAHDARLSTEFENEVDMLLNIDHLNLVKMIGYLEENDERILVVEYIPNGNLREHLDGVHGVVLDLAMRLDICIDVAHALTYLHLYADKPIIHRDVKPSNILLTEKFRAKVADFGYSRMGPLELGETHVSTQVKGTAGYLDPEYLKKFQLTEKSDVYSFGILLMEIITGRRPIDEKKEMKERVAIRWAFRKFLDGKVIEILDPRLEKTNAACMAVERMSELAFQCAAPTKQDRPCMKKVAEVLWDIRKDYQNHLQETRRSSLPESTRNSSSRLSQELKLKSLSLNEKDMGGSERLSG